MGMTYEALETFKNIFLGDARNTPTSSEYSEHLSGDRRLSVKVCGSRFFCAWVKSGEIPDGTPIVALKGTRGTLAVMLFRHRTNDGRELFDRVARYFNCGLEYPEELELPFFGADLSGLCPARPDGDRFRFLEEVLQYLQQLAISEMDIVSWEEDLEYSDAPFCVQSHHLCTGRLPDFSNPYLDARGVPIKGKEAEWWKSNTKPMDCANIKWRCDKEECSKRKFGVNSASMPQLGFGQLTQFQNASVFYTWDINGKEVRFDAEIDIMRQERFMPICMREVGILPRRMANEPWLRIVNKALRSMKVVGSRGASDLTIDRLRDILVNELRRRTLVSTYYEHERLMQGWIYIDPSSSSMVIEPNAVCSYIKGIHPEIEVGGMYEFHAVLRHLGFRGKKRSIDGVDRTLLFVRTEFIFDRREDWVKYMLDVSKGTMWEGNFRAFLLDEPSGIQPLDDEDAAEMDEKAALFLDTERGGMRQ